MGGVWTERWRVLKVQYGLTKSQAVGVFNLLEKTRAFGYQWVADSAYKQLEEVYSDAEVIV